MQLAFILKWNKFDLLNVDFKTIHSVACYPRFLSLHYVWNVHLSSALSNLSTLPVIDKDIEQIVRSSTLRYLFQAQLLVSIFISAICWLLTEAECFHSKPLYLVALLQLTGCFSDDWVVQRCLRKRSVLANPGVPHHRTHHTGDFTLSS